MTLHQDVACLMHVAFLSNWCVGSCMVWDGVVYMGLWQRSSEWGGEKQGRLAWTAEPAVWRVPGSSRARHRSGHRLGVMQCCRLVPEQLTLLWWRISQHACVMWCESCIGWGESSFGVSTTEKLNWETCQSLALRVGCGGMHGKPTRLKTSTVLW